MDILIKNIGLSSHKYYKNNQKYGIFDLKRIKITVFLINIGLMF